MPRLLAIALVIAAGAVAAPAAGAAVTQLPKPPYKCTGANGDGCYRSHPGEMDNTFVADLTIDDHVIRPGETLTATVTPLGFGVHDWQLLGGSPGLTAQNCLPGALTCTYLATDPLGFSFWAELQYTFPSAAGTGIEQDYYTILSPGEYEITGTVMRPREDNQNVLRPAPNVSVTVGGETKQTNQSGVYSVFVDEGTYAVSATDAAGLVACVAPRTPGTCNTSKQVTTPGDQRVDLVLPPQQVKVKGRVTVEPAGKPVSGLVLHAAGERATTDARGRYEFQLDRDVNGDATIEANTSDENFRPATGADCTPAGQGCTFTLDRDRTIDFVSGCAGSVTFPGAMAAVNGCFEKKPGVDVYTTGQPFRMNGIDYDPRGGEVTLDREHRTVSFSGPFWFTLPRLDLTLQGVGVTLDFTQNTQTITPPPVLGNFRPERFKGIAIPVEAKFALEGTEGSTRMTFTASVPENLAGKWSGNGFDFPSQAANTNVLSGTAFLLTTNDTGVTEFGVSLAGSDALAAYSRPDSANGSEGAKNVRTFKLQEVRLSWLFDGSGGWRAGGKLSWPTTGGGSLGIDGEFLFGPSFVPQRLKASGDGIDRKAWGPFYLQRLGIDLPLGQVFDWVPFELSFGAGFSLGPRNQNPREVVVLGQKVTLEPAELLGLDGNVTVTDQDRQFGFVGEDIDTVITGKVDVKVWDQPYGNMTLTLIPGRFAAILQGEAHVSDPFGIFRVQGAGRAWVDGLNAAVQSDVFAGLYADIEGRASVNFPAFHSSGAGRAIVNGAQRTVAACLIAPDGSLGLVHPFGGRSVEITGCDLSAYEGTPPGVVVFPQDSAGGARSFRVQPRTDILGLRIAGSGGMPRVRIEGPGGVKATSPAAGAAGNRKVLVSAAPDQKAVYAVLRSPRAGRWRIVPVSGRIAKVGYAHELPDPQVSATIAGDGCAPRLRYSTVPLPGQTVMLEQRSRATSRSLGRLRRRSGTIRMSPLPGGRQQVIAHVLRNGVPAGEPFALAEFDGAVPARLSAPVDLDASRRGRTVSASWAPVCGAKRYRVSVAGAKGRTVRGTRAKLTLAAGKVRGRKTLRVVALDAAGHPGAAARVAVR
jgi:hypothetical protein